MLLNIHLSSLTPYADDITLRHPCSQRLRRPDTHRMFGILRNVGGKIQHMYVTLREHMM